MNYELAKKLHKAGLKDASFDYGRWVMNVPFKETTPEPTSKNDKYGYRFPTLSELIDACGDDFRELENTFDGYRAYGRNLEGMWAKTPEESIALLWLELHKSYPLA